VVGYTSHPGSFLDRFPAITVLATMVLAAGVMFAIKNSSNQQVFSVDERGNISTSGSIVLGKGAGSGSWKLMENGGNLSFLRNENSLWIPKGGVTP
jgi:hypothetical protein